MNYTHSVILTTLLTVNAILHPAWTRMG